MDEMSEGELRELLDSIDTEGLEYGCDFCADTHLAWLYPTEDFDFFGTMKQGAWLTCEGCHLLIETGDDDELDQRSVVATEQQFGEMTPMMRDSVAAGVQVLHRMWREHRTGPPRVI